MLSKIDEALFSPEKGGPGSGCHGDTCGRPTKPGSGTGRKPSGPVTDSSDDKPITVPGSPLRDADSNNDIIRVPAHGRVPKSLDQVVDEFLQQYSGLMTNLAKLEEEEKKNRG